MPTKNTAGNGESETTSMTASDATGRNAGLNPSITAFFEAPKFATTDKVTGKSMSAYISAMIDSNSFETIQRHVQIGSKLLIRARNNRSGGITRFLEVLPPQNDSQLRGNQASGDEI